MNNTKPIPDHNTHPKFLPTVHESWTWVFYQSHGVELSCALMMLL